MNLPQELIDYIIDFFADDRSALRDICLASKAWLYRPQHHLLKKITITTRDSSALLQFSNCLITSPSSQNRYHSFGHHVHKLTVEKGRLRNFVHVFLDVQDILGILYKLPNLKAFTLRNVHLTDNFPPDPALRTPFSLEMLMLFFVHFYTDARNHISALIQSFSSIRTIHVKCPLYYGSIDQVAELPFPPKQWATPTEVETICFSMHPNEYALEVAMSVLGQSVDLTSVLSLEFCPNSQVVQYRAMERFIHSCPKLLTLTLDLCSLYMVRQPPDWKTLNISHPNLHCLKLSAILRFRPVAASEDDIDPAVTEYITSFKYLRNSSTVLFEHWGPVTEILLITEDDEEYGTARSEISVPSAMKKFKWAALKEVIREIPGAQKMTFDIAVQHMNPYKVEANDAMTKKDVEECREIVRRLFDPIDVTLSDIVGY